MRHSCAYFLTSEHAGDYWEGKGGLVNWLFDFEN